VIETGLLCRVTCLTTGAFLFPQTLAGEVWVSSAISHDIAFVDEH